MLRCTTSFCVIILMCFTSEAVFYEGDSCVFNSEPGICTHQDRCLELKNAFDAGKIVNEEIPRCGYSIHKEIICCPIRHKQNSILTTQIVRMATRVAVEACYEIDEGFQSLLNTSSVNRSSVRLNLYPYMVAIGHQRIGDYEHHFEFKCSGSLIAKKFIICAAHCATDTELPTTHVLLGVADLNDISNGVIMDIKQIHAHPNFSASSTYNDLAVIELRLEIQYTANIYPICLFTENADLTGDAELIVTGWGNRAASERSNLLLKSKVNLVQMNECTTELGTIDSNLHLGIQHTQLCAKYLERGTCAGHSGGPLVLVENKNSRKYRLVGIIVAGFGCGYSAPDIYTRISTFLTFIENIVWPNKVLS